MLAPDGAQRAILAVPDACAVTVARLGAAERIIVAARPERQPVASLAVFTVDRQPAPALALASPLTGFVALTTGPDGDLYAAADFAQVYRLGTTGAVKQVLGAGQSTRNQDGSELLHSVAVDATGAVYAMTWGNPGMVVRFDADGHTVSRREGQFAWADAWSIHSAYVPLALDPDGRLWLGVSGQRAEGTKDRHYRPCVLRTQADFLRPGAKDVLVSSTTGLGLVPKLSTSLPYDIAYDLSPIVFDLRIAPARRRVTSVQVAWRVQDTFGQRLAEGKLDLPLTDGAEALRTLTFRPPRLGWYTLSADLSSAGEKLMAIGHHIGVTRETPAMPRLAAGDSPGGTVDVPRSVFSGLPLVRVNTGMGLDALAKHAETASRYGATLLVQFENKDNCAPDKVRAAVERLRGKVRYWEVVNEPNFSMKPEDYVVLLRGAGTIVHELDPAAQVLGPAVCGMDLGWYRQFLELGGGKLVDAVSMHDYEGHESIDPNHWVYKLGELRRLMAANGCADKPIWQTERALCGVRGGNLLGCAQAIRMTLHRDLLETLCIPSEHNLHYYLNDHGFSQCPTWIWAAAGPHPAAMALRNRALLVGERHYAGALSFGAFGDRLFMGTRYGADGDQVVVLRNLGCADTPLTFAVGGTGPLAVVDAFGNEQSMTARAGQVDLTLGQLPCYVRLPKGRTLTPPTLADRPNLAVGATWNYSAEHNKGFDRLTNGVYETIHAGNPNGSTDKPPIFDGALPSLPQTLSMKLAAPGVVDSVVLWSLRADNAFSALLDFDLEVLDGTTWRAVAKVRTPCPPTELVQTPLCSANTWYGDQNVHWCRFTPVKTSEMRVVVRRTTHGFVPDGNSSAWGNQIPPRLMLKEVQVLGPAARR
ncbi:MAG: hypothetical protein HZB16_03085 [Armatimonadetes bacterium]|nr:hypothetical protein [Armatimonadota bacterium]